MEKINKTDVIVYSNNREFPNPKFKTDSGKTVMCYRSQQPNALPMLAHNIEGKTVEQLLTMCNENSALSVYYNNVHIRHCLI